MKTDRHTQARQADRQRRERVREKERVCVWFVCVCV